MVEGLLKFRLRTLPHLLRYHGRGKILIPLLYGLRVIILMGSFFDLYTFPFEEFSPISVRYT